MDKDLNVRPDTIKVLEEYIGRTLFDINHSIIFLNPSPNTKEIKAIKQMGPNETLKFLHRKRNHQPSEKTVY